MNYCKNRSITNFGLTLQVQAIVDQHHDVKQATKVRFQEPSAGSGEADKDKDKDTKQLSLAVRWHSK